MYRLLIVCVSASALAACGAPSTIPADAAAADAAAADAAAPAPDGPAADGPAADAASPDAAAPDAEPACLTSADCDDGLFCNGDETCDAVLGCQAGTPPAVDDAIACTVDVCDEAADTVTHAPDDAQCADSDPCTDDVCQPGTGCIHPVVCTCSDASQCEDGNPCTDDVCTPLGECANLANAATCDDGLFCNGADACSGGACSAHTGNPCTGGPVCNDACNETADNCLAAAGAPCPDTTPADCLAAGCTGAGSCDQASAPAAIGSPCEDALYCNGADACDAAGGCTVHAGDPCPTGCDEAANACEVQAQFVSVVAGGDRSCGLTAAGAAYCWGRDNNGALGDGGGWVDSPSPSPVDITTIAGNKAFVQLTAGRYHGCGLTAAGAAYCWGWDFYGQLGNGGTAVTAVSPSAVSTAPIPGNRAFVQLTAGGSSTCGLTAAGVAYCWGNDSHGQLGNGGTSAESQSPSPVDTTLIPGNPAFVQLTAGDLHACGLTADGAAYCWGSDSSGQLGNGGAAANTQGPSAVATTAIAGNPAFVQLTAGAVHTCGLTADGVAYCWGYDGSGQLGNGGGSASAQSPSAVDTTPIPGNKTFVRLYAGRLHTCGVTADAVAYCWGDDAAGQLGTGGVSANVQSPAAVATATIAGNPTFLAVTAGDAHTCGLTADGVTYCWGSDSAGQLGDAGLFAATQSPSAVDLAPVIGGKAFVQLAAGGAHGCGVTSDHRALCWGGDASGQLGNGAGGASQSPVAIDTSPITGNTAIVRVAAGEARSCALTASGVAYCWGHDGSGALGNGAAVGSTSSPSPVDTSTMTGQTAFAELALGRSHTCGLTVIGAIYCWGSDGFGQLGTGGTSVNTQSPAAVDTSTIGGNRAFVHLTAGLYHTCAIAADGAPYCWGYDGVGELGTGGASIDTQSPAAVDVTTVTGNRAFIRLTAGWDQTCGRTATGAAYCWGYDSVGQLGNGGGAADAQSPSPVDTSTIPGNRVIVGFAGGGDHMCGATADGGAACWGADNLGQLGNGGGSASTQSPSPINTAAMIGNAAIIQIAAGFFHSCGIAANGVAYCWGDDLDGQLGNGGAGVSTQSPSPIDTSPL